MTKPTIEEIHSFELLHPLIDSFADEMRELSKKKPDGVLNKLKVLMINKRLIPMKNLLKIIPVGEFLDQLDEETMPTNSDVVLILGQYQGAFQTYRSKFRSGSFGASGWMTDKGMVYDKEL